jgi:serine/threonine protein kinase
MQIMQNRIPDGNGAPMKAEFPNPGHGFKIKELVGGGNWKTAYRASSTYDLGDVALLYLRDDKNQNVFAKDVFNILRGKSDHRFFAYLAEFKGINLGEDGQMFLVEEFLARPLDVMSPLNDLIQFVRIARDLCRGLLCLHESHLIHRDLKLDNCGVDNLKRAKIFDLGSVTSEEGEIRGSVLTRAPELFAPDALCHYASDVWALGATLFALRTNAYPFVLDSELKTRQQINSDLRNGKIDLSTARTRKSELDGLVEQRIAHPYAWSNLNDRIHENLRGRSKEILLRMLDFDPSKRSEIKKLETEWTSLAQDLGTVSPTTRHEGKWEKITHQLRAVERKELTITPKQVERIIAEINADPEIKEDLTKDAEVRALIKRVKEIVS